MKTLIAYASKYGTTKECAELLAASLKGEADLVNLGTTPTPSLAEYEAVVVGGSIYAGLLRKPVRQFCKKNKHALLRVRFGCFLCKASPSTAAQEEFLNNFDSDLLAHASAKSNFGGRVNEDTMGFWDKLIMGAVAKHSGMRPPHIDPEKIRSFALAMELTDQDYKMEDGK